MRLAILASHPVQYYAPLFRALAGQADVHVFFAHRTTPEQQAAQGFGVSFAWDVDLLSGYSHSFLTNIAARPGTDHFSGCDTPEISDRLAEGRFDVVLVMGWYLKSFLQGLFAAKRLGLPVMVRGDSHLDTGRTGLKVLLKALVFPAFLRLFDAALYVGGKSRAYYQHYRYPQSRLFFSPHCVDTEWFAARATPQAREALRAKQGIAPDAKILLFAGKLLPFKRPLDMISAAALCRCDGDAVEVMVAGSGVLAEAVVAKAQEQKVPLHMLGFCNQSEMPAAYAASDMLVLPSDGHETWGLVANEALACGRPVILSDACGAAPDLAADGQAGCTYKLGDIDALAGSIRGMIAAPPSAAAIAARSRQYSLQAAADGILQAGRHLVARSGQ